MTIELVPLTTAHITLATPFVLPGTLSTKGSASGAG